MGCQATVPKKVVHHKAPISSQASAVVSPVSSHNSNDHFSTTFGDFISELYNGIEGIGIPYGLVPTLCYSSTSFPVLTAPLSVSFNRTISIQMPIISATSYGKGRVVCFSHIKMLSRPSFEEHQNKQLYQRIIQWSCKRYSPSAALLLNMEKGYTSELISAFTAMGFYAERGTVKSSIAQYRIICIGSNIELKHKSYIKLLESYVRHGGALLVFYIPSDTGSWNANELLSLFGVAYAGCSLSGRAKGTELIPVPRSVGSLQIFTFNAVCSLFTSSLTHPSFELIDDLCVSLRYYLMSVPDKQYEKVASLADACWSYLVKTNFDNRLVEDDDDSEEASLELSESTELHYGSGRAICKYLIQRLIVVLYQDLISHYPIEKIDPNPHYIYFPGDYYNPVAEAASSEFEGKKHAWISTGLYLPAGTVGSIELVACPGIVAVQIGCHTLSLVNEKDVWYRWPCITSYFSTNGYIPSDQEHPKAENEVMKVSSPFGGIVYLISDGTCDGKIKANFDGFAKLCMVTRAKIVHPDTSPWCELYSTGVTFAMPTNTLNDIPNYKLCIQKYDLIFSMLCTICGRFSDRIFRVVFDCNIPGNKPKLGYPIVFGLDHIKRLFYDFESPTDELFLLVKWLFISMIREGKLDPGTEDALSAVVACMVFRALFPDFVYTSISRKLLPQLFPELWEIVVKLGRQQMKDTIASIQSDDYIIHGDEPDEDKWFQFFNTLCRYYQRSFVAVFKHFKPIPLSVIQTASVYQEYNPL